MNFHCRRWGIGDVQSTGSIVLREVIIALYPGAMFETMPADVETFLQRKKTPSWLMEEFASAYTNKYLAIGPLQLSPVRSIVDNNTGVPYGFFCDSGYLNVACGSNGDLVAVELESGKMLFVHHDEFWEYYPDVSGVTSPPDVRTRMIDPGMDFGEFWAIASEDPEFPCDAYEAEQRWPRYLVESERLSF